MKRMTLAVMALLSLLSAPAQSAPPRPVPEMTLTSLDAGRVSGADLAAPARWLLVYLTGDGKTDQPLICALQGFSGDPRAGRVTVVVPGVTLAALEEMVLGQEKLSDLRWLADTDRSAAKALKLAGSTAILGLEGNVIRWDLSGAGKEQDALRSLLTDWVR